jgi:hypothetical protein
VTPQFVMSGLNICTLRSVLTQTSAFVSTSRIPLTKSTDFSNVISTLVLPLIPTSRWARVTVSQSNSNPSSHPTLSSTLLSYLTL